jgi:hypothetical protein
MSRKEEETYLRKAGAKKSNRSFDSCLPAAGLPICRGGQVLGTSHNPASGIFISFLNSDFFNCCTQKFKLKLYF